MNIQSSFPRTSTCLQLYRPISVYIFPRRAPTLCLQLPQLRRLWASHLAIYRNRPIRDESHTFSLHCKCNDHTKSNENDERWHVEVAQPGSTSIAHIPFSENTWCGCGLPAGEVAPVGVVDTSHSSLQVAGRDRWQGVQWGRDMWRGGQWGRDRWRGGQWGCRGGRGTRRGTRGNPA